MKISITHPQTANRRQCIYCSFRLHTSIPPIVLITEGDYDVEIPVDAPSGMYKIRVGRFEDDDLFGCSGEFEVVGDDEMNMSFRF